MKRQKAASSQTRLRATPPTNEPPAPTFLEHVIELRRRAFWVIATVMVAASCAYPVRDAIIAALTAPLGDKQLYYMTPVGGLAFVIKLCTYVGILVALPVVMYHMYRYLEPLMGVWRKSAAFYATTSLFLAAGGATFAYFVFLPGSLHFLTGFDIGKITAMLTVDSYLSFVMTYLLGAAVLFQIPIVMLIINNIKPLRPDKLLKSERYVIVVAFVAAMFLSPTPDVMNQVFFALPIIVMYQVGIVAVWLQHRSVRKQRTVPHAAQAHQATQGRGIPADVWQELLQMTDGRQPAAPKPQPMAVRPKPITVFKPVVAPVAARQLVVPQRGPVVVRRSIDGFATPMARA